MLVHARQFVLGPKPIRVHENWIVSSVPRAGWLSRCPELPTERLIDRDGAEWWLLGTVWTTPSAAQQISEARTDEVCDRYRRWAGRWLLIGAGQVHMDAAGLLGCFYRDTWVSSSSALIASTEAPDLPPTRPLLGMDWFPLPCSRFPSVRRLLPSQIFDVVAGVLPRPLLRNAAPRDYNGVLAEIQDHLTGVVRAAARMGRISVPLTAGYDSRLVLATTCAAGLSPRTFTQEYPSMTQGDRTLPPQLARLVGCEHRLIPRRDPKPQRYCDFDAHTAGHCTDEDREFVARGQWDWCRGSDVVLRGGCFEVGRWVMAELGDGPFEVATIRRAFPEQNARALEAIAEWIAWCRSHPEPLEWQDRFYWEQRLGAWLSTIEQGLDLFPAIRGHVANSFRFYELVLSLSKEARRTSQHHVELIGRLAPRLVDLPFNPPAPMLR